MAKKTPEINATSTADIAFLLLVFFLATTTMNVDSGIYRRLPPYQPDNTEAPKYAKRNILQVLVNRNNQLAINGELADVSTLKDRTIEFVLNPNNSEDLPQKKKLKRSIFSVPWKFRRVLFLFRVIKERHMKCTSPYKIS